MAPRWASCIAKARLGAQDKTGGPGSLEHGRSGKGGRNVDSQDVSAGGGAAALGNRVGRRTLVCGQRAVSPRPQAPPCHQAPLDQEEWGRNPAERWRRQRRRQPRRAERRRRKHVMRTDRETNINLTVMRGRRWVLAVAAVALTLVVAGCGGSSSSGGGSNGGGSGAQPSQSSSQGSIPQNNGGDHDPDNNDATSDGDGNKSGRDEVKPCRPPCDAEAAPGDA